MFNNHVRQGHHNKGQEPVDDWFKFYWMNYGTLTRRDPNHEFERPIKHDDTVSAKNRRNSKGQRHLNFYEKAIEGYEDEFYSAMSKHIAENIDDCYDR